MNSNALWPTNSTALLMLNSSNALEGTAASHSFAAAVQRERCADASAGRRASALIGHSAKSRTSKNSPHSVAQISPALGGQASLEPLARASAHQRRVLQLHPEHYSTGSRAPVNSGRGQLHQVLGRE